MTLSIKTRLALYFSGLFVILLSVFLLIVYGFLTVGHKEQSRKEMIHAAKMIRQEIDEHPTWEQGIAALNKESDEFEIHIRIFDESGRMVFASYGIQDIPNRLDVDTIKGVEKGDFWSSSVIQNKPFVGLTEKFIPRFGNVYYSQILRSLDSTQQTEQRVLIAMALGAPFVLIFSIFAGRVFANSALEPIETIRRKADQMNPQQLLARLPLPSHKDELYWLTQTLNRLFDRIEEAFSQVKRFTEDAAHELRNPLTNIRGILEVVLRKDRTKEEYKAEITSALGESNRLMDLVNDLLTLAEIDANQSELIKKNVDIKAFLEDTIGYAKTFHTHSGIHISFRNLAQGTILLDEVRLRTAILTLIDNAVKYNKPNGEVMISSTIADRRLEIGIKDTGIGIPLNEQEKIFERFYRVDKSRSRESGGTGLGLSIAKSIIEAHGGTISVTSILGTGSEFKITLPLKTA